MKMVGHHAMQRWKDLVARAMAGVESGVGILFHQASGQILQFIFRLVMIEQMEATHDGLYGIRTGRKDVLQTAMGATREKQAIGVKSQFMPEIIMHTLAKMVFHKEVSVAFRHWVDLRNIRYHEESISDFSALVDGQQSLLGYLGPLCRDAMQRQTLGEKPATEGTWRDNDLSAVVDGHEMAQASRMVAMAMGDEHVVNLAEINAQCPCVLDEDIGGTSIEQDAVPVRL